MANANGRVKGQILLGRPKISYTQNKNSGTNRGQTGNTRVAKSVNISGGVKIRNSSSKAAYSANAGQTVGIKGAKVGYVSKGARVANSVSDQTVRNPSQYNRVVNSPIGLQGAGKPFYAQKRTTTQLDNVGDKVSRNTGQYNPHAAPSVGLRGAKLGQSGKGPRKGSNLGRAAGDKNSQNPYVNPPHANDTQGLTKVRAQRGRAATKLQSSGTGKTGAGGKGIAFMGNKRQVISSLRPQKSFVAGIPAQIRRAAARAPSNGSSRPSFTTKVVKITSK